MHTHKIISRKNFAAFAFSVLFGLMTILGSSNTSQYSHQNGQAVMEVIEVADGGVITLPPVPNHGG